MKRHRLKLLLLAGMLIFPGAVLVWIYQIKPRSVPSGSTQLDTTASFSQIVAPTLKHESAHVIVKPPDAFPIDPKSIIQKVLKYGQAEGEIGIIRAIGQTPIGPESFTVDPKGNIFVADQVNHRINIYSNDGTVLRSINIFGIDLNDVAVDDKGSVLVYDQAQHKLFLCNDQGVIQSELGLNPINIATRGYFHVVNDLVYFADAACRDVVVATLRNGSLTQLDTPIDRQSNGIHGASGRIYSVNIQGDQSFLVQAEDPNQLQETLKVEISLAGVKSATFLGEDENRRFFVQTERLLENTIVLEVLVFNSKGEFQSTTLVPENDYAFWTAKLVGVMPSGAILQFLPQNEQAKLNIF